MARFLSAVRPAADRLASGRRRVAGLAAFAASFVFVSVHAQQLVAQQFGATAVNGSGNALYNLTLTPNNPANTGALLSGTQQLNTDGSSYGQFSAVVRVPNSVTSALDLIVADVKNAQIVRYPGPGPASYATAAPIFTWSHAPGPKYPYGLAADVTGNLFVISGGVPSSGKGSLWVLPFNTTTGAYGAPILIDDSFGGNKCERLGDVLVARTGASGAAPAWNEGDVLTLCAGSTSTAAVMVYSQQAIKSVLATGTPLSGPTATVITPSQFRCVVPAGFDIWPADATHGVSLLITTADTGQVMRFDSGSNTFSSDFASGLGQGLLKVRAALYSTIWYAFVAQSTPGNGRILQFGTPPASGPNNPLASVSTGVDDPLGLTATSSGSVPVSECIAPSVCDPLGSQLTVEISGPGTSNLPPNAPVLQESCVINSDPRVTVSGTTWSCAGGNLDVSNYCPGFPSTVLPGSLCGHSGPSGSGFVVVKGTAKVVDQNVNNTFVYQTVDPNVPLPGPLNLNCPQEEIFAWAPRSDLPSIEGTIVEGGPAPGSNYFIDLSGFCDSGGGTTHSVSMLAYGLGLNTSTSGLGAGLPGFVTDKFTNLQSTITLASGQITPSTAATLQGYISQAQSYFNSGVAETASNGISCAMNSLASADSYLRSNLSSFSGASPPGNINPAGEIDGRLGNLFLTIDEYFLFQPPNLEWPTSNVPPCMTLAVAPSTLVTSSTAPATATLTWGTVNATYPLLYSPAQCTLSASAGTFTTPASEAGSGSVSTGALTMLGTYSAQLTCAAAAGNTITSFTQANANVIALASLSVAPSMSTVASGGTVQLTATGTYSDNSMQNLTAAAAWSSSASSVATVSAGLVSCNPSATGQGSATITAMSATATGTTSGSATVTCLAPLLESIAVTPSSLAVAAGGTAQLTATGTYSSGSSQPLSTATWTSSAASVATVSASGLVTCNPAATVAGSATITATSGNITGSATVSCQAPVVKSIAVTPARPPEIAYGGTLQLTATATYGNGLAQNVTTTATWSSSAASVATVSASGLVTCQHFKSWRDESAKISATIGATTGSTTVTCEQPGGDED